MCLSFTAVECLFYTVSSIYSLYICPPLFSAVRVIHAALRTSPVNGLLLVC